MVAFCIVSVDSIVEFMFPCTRLQGRSQLFWEGLAIGIGNVHGYFLFITHAGDDDTHGRMV